MRCSIALAVMVAGFAHASPTLADSDSKKFGTCTKDGKGYVPDTLDAAMAELERLLGKKAVAEFKKHGPAKYHHGLGTGLRNCWGLWGGSPLGKWFNQKGIKHPDDMSGILLASFHRRLHGRPIDLEGQIKYYQGYWKKQQEDYEKGTSSGRAVFDLVSFVKGEGWVSVTGEMIPRIGELVAPLRAHAQKALTSCWRRLPKTPGSSAVGTTIAIAISKAGKVSSAKVVKTAVPIANATCMANALEGAKVPKHAGASYTLTLQSYRMVEPK